MELFIETLTGTAFELRVSPFETILSVKAKIQRLEGIPLSQQHLIWQSMELEDDYCLHDYGIQDGATLKLVLAMRGGPINTRRVPMEDPALREMAEYMEANRDDLLDKLPGNRQVTLLVYREGDQLNFFRVVDRGDGTLTPLSESLSGASVYNLYDDEDEDAVTPTDNVEENMKMREKMKLLRSKMESLTVMKKPKKKSPHPPPGRPKSRGRQHHHLYAASTGKSKHHALPYNLVSKNYPLPPVSQSQRTYNLPPSGQDKHELSLPSKSFDDVLNNNIKAQKENVATSHTGSEDVVKDTSNSTSKTQVPGMLGLRALPGPKMLNGLNRVPVQQSSVFPAVISRPKSSKNKTQPKVEPIPTKQSLQQTPLMSKQNSNNVFVNSSNDSFVPREAMVHRPLTSSLKREAALETVKEVQPLQTALSPVRKGRLSKTPDNKGSGKERLLSPSCNDSLGRPGTSTKYNSTYPGSSYDRNKQGLLLESLTSQEARGLLRQASLERLGSSKISSYVRSATKSRSGYRFNGDRIYSPDGSRMSARLKRSAGRDGCLSPRLPPVRHKKKNVKRCYICGKKTGLATSYQCRCGNNFCATHRYAETHSCTFDYKSEGRKLLEQNNPVITAPKLPKI